MDDEKHDFRNQHAFEYQIHDLAGVNDPDILKAMREIPRHLFVPPELISAAYYNQALPIGYGQTISQPLIVAYMTNMLRPKSTDKILEIGTGSGYQAAILSKLCKKVYTIEIVEPLAAQAQKRFEELNLKNIEARAGDGYHGWPEAAPFDSIILTAAPERIPMELVKQLKVGGKMILPIGRQFNQKLVLLTKAEDGTIHEKDLIDVIFVPLTRKYDSGSHL